MKSLKVYGINEKEVDIELVDLSSVVDGATINEENPHGYKCDTVILDLSPQVLKENRNKIDSIIAANQREPNSVTGNIVATIHKNDFFENLDLPKAEELDVYGDFKKKLKSELAGCNNSFVLDVTDDTLVDSLVPGIINKDMQFEDMIHRLQNDKMKGKDSFDVVISALTHLGGYVSVAFDKSNPYTDGHSFRVRQLTNLVIENMRFDQKTFEEQYANEHTKFEDVCVDTGEKDKDGNSIYKFSRDYVALASTVALIHDIGKIGIPYNILNKPGALTDPEYAVMKQHSGLGNLFFEKLASEFPESEYPNVSEQLKYVGNLVSAHHERYDGNGYPKRLKGNQIDLIAQVMAVADSFDAMTTTRSYNNPKTFEQATIELIGNSGSQFAPDVVYTLLNTLYNEREVIDEHGTHKEAGLISSPEEYKEFMSSNLYDYRNPPHYDLENHLVEAQNPRNYEPDYELVGRFRSEVLRDRESFDRFARKAKNLYRAYDFYFIEKRIGNLEDIGINMQGIRDRYAEISEQIAGIVGGKKDSLNLRHYMDISEETIDAANSPDIVSRESEVKQRIFAINDAVRKGEYVAQKDDGRNNETAQSDDSRKADKRSDTGGEID